MTDCPFCQIASDSAHGSVLVRGNVAVAFLDIRPIRPGHAIVVPIRHEADFLSLRQDEHLEMLSIAKQIGAAQYKLFQPMKIGLLVAGFDVPHAHLHVVPMNEYHDLTSSALLNGTLKRSSDQDLAAIQLAITEVFHLRN